MGNYLDTKISNTDSNKIITKFTFYTELNTIFNETSLLQILEKYYRTTIYATDTDFITIDLVNKFYYLDDLNYHDINYGEVGYGKNIVIYPILHGNKLIYIKHKQYGCGNIILKDIQTNTIQTLCYDSYVLKSHLRINITSKFIFILNKLTPSIKVYGVDGILIKNEYIRYPSMITHIFKEHIAYFNINQNYAGCIWNGNNFDYLSNSMVDLIGSTDKLCMLTHSTIRIYNIIKKEFIGNPIEHCVMIAPEIYQYKEMIIFTDINKDNFIYENNTIKNLDKIRKNKIIMLYKNKLVTYNEAELIILNLDSICVLKSIIIGEFIDICGNCIICASCCDVIIINVGNLDDMIMCEFPLGVDKISSKVIVKDNFALLIYPNYTLIRNLTDNTEYKINISDKYNFNLTS